MLFTIIVALASVTVEYVKITVDLKSSFIFCFREMVQISFAFIGINSHVAEKALDNEMFS